MNKQSVMLQENSNQEKVMYIVYFDYNSDCFINAPDTLIEHVTHFYELEKFIFFVIMLFICRAIDIGSLTLKWFDWLLLILNLHKLYTDELQFGF